MWKCISILDTRILIGLSHTGLSHPARKPSTLPLREDTGVKLGHMINLRPLGHWSWVAFSLNHWSCPAMTEPLYPSWGEAKVGSHRDAEIEKGWWRSWDPVLVAGCECSHPNHPGGTSKA